MKGKSEFTTEEADRIRLLINEKVNASVKEQKGIRDKIRELGFYYTDFSKKRIRNGFTVDDFNSFIKSGLITINL